MTDGARPTLIYDANNIALRSGRRRAPALPVNTIRIIERKSAGDTLEATELQAFLRAYLEGDVPDYQMAAFLMAVWFRGLSGAELDAVLHTMIASGASLDLSHLDGPRVDKHSTGGV